jgi:hypothetical protein
MMNSGLWRSPTLDVVLTGCQAAGAPLNMPTSSSSSPTTSAMAKALPPMAPRAALHGASISAAVDKPNVLLIVCDDPGTLE